MNSNSYVLGERRGLVFETHRPGQVYVLGDTRRGTFVSVAAPPLEEMLASFYAVMPDLSERPGTYNVLTVARGLPARPPAGPRYWNPVLLARANGGVYVRVTYHSEASRLGFRMNVGSATPRLRGFFIEHLPPDLLAGRLLHFFLLLRQDVLFGGVDAEDLLPEVLGHGQTASTGSRLRPWGASTEGAWWISSGPGLGDREASLDWPPGFGLSDLKVWLRTGPEDVDGCPPYSGALDRLSRPLPVPDEAPEPDLFTTWKGGDEEEVPNEGI